MAKILSIMKGAVATGHPLSSKAAVEMFSCGGNAFDAVVSAGFASVVTEPTLTSLGGGGFLLAHIENQKTDILFDFFVNTPGLDRKDNVKRAMNPVEVQFPGCSQTFYIGYGSIAVPGMLKGLLHIHKRLCTLPMETIVKPALTYLEEGVEVNEKQEIFLNYLKPIFTSTSYGKQLYVINGRYAKQHDKLYNPLLKNFLKEISHNGHDIYSGEIANKLICAMKKHKGMMTQKDLEAYEVSEREPLRIRFRNKEIVTNPPPSFGGIMLALSLMLLENVKLSHLSHDSEEYLIKLIEIMKEINSFRSIKKGNWIDKIAYPFQDAETSSFIESFKKNIVERMVFSTQGTTHISVIDEEGNAASMTTSNGEGSGCFIPETGIMLNNMMGEDDLHPDGFFELSPHKKVSSMMLPTMIMKNGSVEAVMGSGGSKRIRTAILQVLVKMIDLHYPLKDAIETSRIHFDDGTVQAEPEISEHVLFKLKKHYNINVWSTKNMYFGGVHAVSSNMEGWGDTRRGGNFERKM